MGLVGFRFYRFCGWILDGGFFLHVFGCGMVCSLFLKLLEPESGYWSTKNNIFLFNFFGVSFRFVVKSLL